MWNENQNPSASYGTSVANLKAGVSGQTITGLVIAKQNGRQIASKNGEDRGALSFTIQDSSAIVNVTCWGTFQFIQQLSQKFFISDVVKFTNCVIQDRPDTEQDKIFNPETTVPFKISVDQKSSKIETLTYGCEEFDSMRHKPPHKENNFITLDQITNPQTSHIGRFINCLVIIKTAPSKRTLITKSGRQATNCEFEVMDSSKEVVRLVMWLDSLADLTYSLTPKQTLLFLTDAKVKLDTFTESVSLEATTKTIITVNPDIKPAHDLYAFAQKLPNEILQPSIRRISTNNNNKASLDSITNEVTIEEIVHSCPESGVVNAVLTTFDCSDTKRSISMRCTGCQKKVPGLCAKPDCFGKDVVPFFDFTVSLTDHTGTTDNVKLTGECAEKLIGVPVTIFEAWNSESTGECMDRVQLERYKIVFTSFTMPSGFWIQIKQIDSWVPSMAFGS